MMSYKCKPCGTATCLQCALEQRPTADALRSQNGYLPGSERLLSEVPVELDGNMTVYSLCDWISQTLGIGSAHRLQLVGPGCVPLVLRDKTLFEYHIGASDTITIVTRPDWQTPKQHQPLTPAMPLNDVVTALSAGRLVAPPFIHQHSATSLVFDPLQV
jgi:hypothetical protein